MKNKYILALSLLFVSASAMADDSWTEVYDAEDFAQAFEDLKPRIRIMADFTASEGDVAGGIYLIDTATILDLNGHSVNLSAPLGPRGKGGFDIVDLSDKGEGRLTGGSMGLLSCLTTGEVHIKGGIFETTNIDGFRPVIDVGKAGILFIEGGRIYANEYSYAIENTGNVTMTGGTIIGIDEGHTPVYQDRNGVFKVEGGAIYAGNQTSSVCFENNIYEGDDGYREEPVVILPEGVYDGGAIVIDEKWAIPGSRYINYHLGDGFMITAANHYYFPGEEFDLPVCDYKDGVPFGGWSTSPDGSGELLTKITASTNENLQLYPVWKYVGIPETVSPDLTTTNITPEPNSQVEKIEEIILAYGEETLIYVNRDIETAGYIQNLTTNRIVSELSIDKDWEGNVTLTANPPVTANGSYLVFVPAGTFGTDDWYYGDMKEGRCNPDLQYRYKIHNRPTGTNDVASDPESGTTVTELSTVKLIFKGEDNIAKNYVDENIKIIGQNNEVVEEFDAANISYVENESDAMLITLPRPIVTNGTYTMNIPEGVFTFDWWERDCSALTFTWTVEREDGIRTVGIDDETATEYYTLDGLRITKPEAGQIVIMRRGEKVSKVIIH